MIQIKTIASGSKGNCYHVTDGNTPLLLECGIPIRQIRQGLEYRLHDVAACLISHEHKDHCYAVKDILRAGVDCHLSAGTSDAISIKDHHRCHVVSPGRVYQVGTWRILPFSLVHDAAEPLGFLLGSGAERLLFATDTAYLSQRFAGLTHLMVECNFDESTLLENVRTGSVPGPVADRVRQTHMGLETLLAMLEANDLSRVQGIWLLHLSEQNADADKIKAEVQRVTGKPVYIA